MSRSSWILALISPIVFSAQAEPLFLPGSASAVTLSLSITSEVPKTFAKDGEGRFITDEAGKKIPAYSNEWSVENPRTGASTDFYETNVQIVKRRYSNKEFLNDLVNAGVIPGPIAGWSIQRVAAYYAEHDPDSGLWWVDDYAIPMIKIYAIKPGQQPVLIPEEVFSITSPYVEYSLWGLREGIVSGINRFESVSWDGNGEQIGGKFSSKRNSICITTIQSEIGEAQPIDLINPPEEWGIGDGEDIRLHNIFQLSGIETPKEGAYRRILINGNGVHVPMQGASKINAIQGTGPELRSWSVHGGYSLVSQSLVEGTISFAAGKYGDFTSYPGIEE